MSRPARAAAAAATSLLVTPLYPLHCLTLSGVPVRGMCDSKCNSMRCFWLFLLLLNAVVADLDAHTGTHHSTHNHINLNKVKLTTTPKTRKALKEQPLRIVSICSRVHMRLCAVLSAVLCAAFVCVCGTADSTDFPKGGEERIRSGEGFVGDADWRRGVKAVEDAEVGGDGAVAGFHDRYLRFLGGQDTADAPSGRCGFGRGSFG